MLMSFIFQEDDMRIYAALWNILLSSLEETILSFEICRLGCGILAKVHLINGKIKCVLSGRHNYKTTGGGQRLHLIKAAQSAVLGACHLCAVFYHFVNDMRKATVS